jgi:type IV pilus assembly protein PilQ
MSVDDSMAKEGIILLDTPERVSMVFQNADIRDVLNTIAMQANANLVIDQDITGQVTLRLENVPWKSALQMVVKTRDFVAIDEPDNTIRITTPARVEKQLDIRIFRLLYASPEGTRYTPVLVSDFTEREAEQQSTSTSAAGAPSASAASLMNVLKNVATPQGKISFEKRSNSIVARDTQTALENMDSIIRKLDVPPKQVHVAVKLVELSDTDVERLGVDWSSGIRFNLNPVSNWVSAFPFDVSEGLSRSLLGDLTVASGTRRAIDPLTGGALGSGSPDVFSLRRATATQGGGLQLSDASGVSMGSMGFAGTSALLELIRDKTKGRIVQAPQLVTLDNEEATIQVGQLVRYAETIVANTEGGGNVGGFREANGSPLKLGFQLLVIPHVTGPENNILMTILPKTENFQAFEVFGDLKLPQTSNSIIISKMMLRNGETGVIGGLKEETESYTERKVPGLGDIPFLGRLFKHRAKNNRIRNLLVFVTPTIIDFYETDQFKKDLEKIRQDYSKPFTTIGEEEELSSK